MSSENDFLCHDWKRCPKMTFMLVKFNVKVI